MWIAMRVTLLSVYNGLIPWGGLSMTLKLFKKIESMRCSNHPLWRSSVWVKDLGASVMGNYNRTLQREGKCLEKNGLRVLQDAYDACGRSKIRPFLVEGTLLGHCRENGFIGHDNDVDLGIFEEESGQLDLLEKEMRQSGYTVTKRKKGLISFIRERPDVGFYIFFKRAENRRCHYIEKKNARFRYDFPADIFAPLQKARFEDQVEVLVPYRPEGYLAAAYGDWRTPLQKKDVFEPNLQLEGLTAAVIADKQGVVPESVRKLVFLLDKNGIADIIIITGHGETAVKTELREERFRSKLTFIRNEKHAVSGTGYSLLLAAQCLDDSVLVAEPRILYNENALKQAIRAGHPNAIMIKKYFDKQGSICFPVDRYDVENINAIYLGAAVFSRKFLSRILKKAEQDFARDRFSGAYEKYMVKALKES